MSPTLHAVSASVQHLDTSMQGLASAVKMSKDACVQPPAIMTCVVAGNAGSVLSCQKLVCLCQVLCPANSQDVCIDKLTHLVKCPCREGVSVQADRCTEGQSRWPHRPAPDS